MAFIAEVYDGEKWVDSYTFEERHIHPSGRIKLTNVSKVQSFGDDALMPVEVILPAHLTVISRKE